MGHAVRTRLIAILATNANVLVDRYYAACAFGYGTGRAYPFAIRLRAMHARRRNSDVFAAHINKLPNATPVGRFFGEVVALTARLHAFTAVYAFRSIHEKAVLDACISPVCNRPTVGRRRRNGPRRSERHAACGNSSARRSAAHKRPSRYKHVLSHAIPPIKTVMPCNMANHVYSRTSSSIRADSGLACPESFTERTSMQYKPDRSGVNSNDHARFWKSFVPSVAYRLQCAPSSSENSIALIEWPKS